MNPSSFPQTRIFELLFLKDFAIEMILNKLFGLKHLLI